MTPKGFALLGEGLPTTTLPQNVLETGVVPLERKLSQNRAVLELYAWFRGLSSVRQDVIEALAFEVGTNSMLQFHPMICRLEKKDHDGAGRELLSGEWAAAAGERAGRMAQIMRDGTY